MELVRTSQLVGCIQLAKYRGPRIDDTFNDYLQIDYQLQPPYWGNGYATESAQAVLSYAFGKLGLDRVLVYVRRENERSVRLIERLHFRLIGKRKDDTGKACDVFMRMAEEWRALSPADESD